ncbi:hypothetical protein ACIA74_18270 [Streptomyces sp. NPDC051658]|uniref:hypothetical protein n=1 Tax=unclassified Streptomyces TaxID=2593676 RepID=UPI003794B8F7|nr:hypothetical protein OG520_03620 [Streptomyces sp. NBC_00984]
MTEDRGRNGTCSLLLGIGGAAASGCPLLPSVVSSWIRFFPVYLVVPLGICAVVSGVGALRDMRGPAGADRLRARAGVVLGSMAIVVPVAVVAWAWWALSHLHG